MSPRFQRANPVFQGTALGWDVPIGRGFHLGPPLTVSSAGTYEGYADECERNADDLHEVHALGQNGASEQDGDRGIQRGEHRDER